MARCKNCGYENDDEDTICRQCHYLLKENQKEEKIDLNDRISKEDNESDQADSGNRADAENSSEDNNKSVPNSYKHDDGYYLLSGVERIEHTNYKNNSKKSVLLGCILSFFMTGIGNVYAGLTKRGIIEFIISLIINSFIPITPDYMIDFNSYILYLALLWEFYVIYDTYICIRAINDNRKAPPFLKFFDI